MRYFQLRMQKRYKNLERSTLIYQITLHMNNSIQMFNTLIIIGHYYIKFNKNKKIHLKIYI